MCAHYCWLHISIESLHVSLVVLCRRVLSILFFFLFFFFPLFCGTGWYLTTARNELFRRRSSLRHLNGFFVAYLRSFCLDNLRRGSALAGPVWRQGEDSCEGPAQKASIFVSSVLRPLAKNKNKDGGRVFSKQGSRCVDVRTFALIAMLRRRG